MRCPFHGWAYNGEGRCTLIPSNGADAPVPANATTRAYPVEERGGYLWVYTGKESAANRPPLVLPGELTGEDWTVGREYADVAANYTRVIEQSIDVAHVPWVHRKTIGRGMNPDGRLDRPMLPRHTGLSLYFEDRMPDWLEAIRRPFDTEVGEEPPVALGVQGLHEALRRPDDPESSAVMPMHRDGLHFDMPALFRIVKGGTIAGLFAVPIDEQHTRIYHYVARRWLRRLPLFSRFAVWVNFQVIREDMHVLETQVPNRMPEEINEEFQVRTDAAEIYYRKLRAAYFAAHPDERPRKSAHKQEVGSWAAVRAGAVEYSNGHKD